MKKVNRHRLLAFFTFVALIVLMAVQLNWLFKAAKMEEKNFNHKVTKALKEARDEIGKRLPECSIMRNYLCGDECQLQERKNTINEIDSMIRSKLEVHNINLAYTFEISDIHKSDTKKIFRSKCYQQTLNGLLEKNGIQLRLEFPGRNQFLLAQLKGQFLLAFFSIIFVMISFLLTFRMFVKEQQQVKQTTDFINNMVHEFQTPLANIRLATNLIRKKHKEPNVKMNEYTEVILKEGAKLEQHVTDILKVSCSGKENGIAAQIDINNVIEQTAKDFINRIENRKGKLAIQLSEKSATISGDENHFRLIISNLIDNAIKYSVDAPHILVRSEIKNGKIKVEVKDDGVGVDKKYLAKIFEKYYRVSTGDVHNVKGFGLGLTYVKKTVEYYGGEISVSSQLGLGTIFTIVIPIINEQNKNTSS